MIGMADEVKESILLASSMISRSDWFSSLIDPPDGSSGLEKNNF